MGEYTPLEKIKVPPPPPFFMQNYVQPVRSIPRQRRAPQTNSDGCCCRCRRRRCRHHRGNSCRRYIIRGGGGGATAGASASGWSFYSAPCCPSSRPQKRSCSWFGQATSRRTPVDTIKHHRAVRAGGGHAHTYKYLRSTPFDAPSIPVDAPYHIIRVFNNLVFYTVYTYAHHHDSTHMYREDIGRASPVHRIDRESVRKLRRGSVGRRRWWRGWARRRASEQTAPPAVMSGRELSNDTFGGSPLR